MRTTAPKATAPARSLWTSVRDELREGREARAAHRALERELATFTTPADVNDLLAAVDRSESADAEAIRVILARNLSAYHRRRRLTV